MAGFCIIEWVKQIKKLELTQKIAILGAGSFGNTMAFLLGQHQKVYLWDHNKARVRKTNKTRRFKKPLTQKYPDNVIITSEIEDLLDADIIFNAVSVKGIAEVFRKLKDAKLSDKAIIVNLSKGFETDTLRRPSEIITGLLPNNSLAVISGPNLAKEMINGKPMVTEVASDDLEVAKTIQKLLNGPTLRVYINSDVLGVELAGALKNIIAIAAGCLDGLDQGESAKASLMTRGLAEIAKFVAVMGGKSETLLGPSGVGDLIATSESKLSRNYRVGFYLAKGKKLEKIKETLGEVAEGINTTHAVYSICLEKNIQLPIVEQVKAVLDEKVTPVEAVLNLMNRPVSSTEV